MGVSSEVCSLQSQRVPIWIGFQPFTVVTCQLVHTLLVFPFSLSHFPTPSLSLLRSPPH